MKQALLMFAFIYSITASAQVIKVPYPCKQPVTHDTLLSGSGTVEVPVYGLDCDTTWWGRVKKKKCKDVVTGYKDSVIYFTYNSYVTHDTTITCYKDSIGTPPPAASTLWGCKFQDVTKEEELQLLKAMGCTAFRPNGVALQDYTAGQKFNFDFFYKDSIKVVVNIGWQNAQAGVIRSFATDLKLYEQKLRAFLDAWGKYIYMGVIENEPTNDGYFGTGHIDEYIAELRLATEIFHEYKIPVTDGSTHLEYFEVLRNNDGKVPTAGKANQIENFKEVVKLLAAYKTMPYLTFVNFHTSANGPGYPDNFIIDNVNYLRNATGKEVISNEVALKKTDAATITKIVSQVKAANIRLFIFWSGDGGSGNSDADALHTGTQLNYRGITYRDAIKP